MKTVTARANANIALIKYWGKKDEHLFLPTKSSLSFTIPHLTTTTKISVSTESRDLVTINKKTLCEKKSKNIVRFLDIFRKKYNIDDKFVIDSTNSFPTAAGLASSSSGFAALSKGLNELYDLKLSEIELSILARRGSGSACRSIYNGFVMHHKGKCSESSYAEQLPVGHWPEFCIIIAVVSKHEKKISSRIGMQHTKNTSPFYDEWLKRSGERIPKMVDAIKKKDIHTVGKLAETDCLEMHHCMQTATPPIDYWQPETKKIIESVKQLRNKGIPCYFTIDAGPNVKIITTKKYLSDITEQIEAETCIVP